MPKFIWLLFLLSLEATRVRQINFCQKRVLIVEETPFYVEQRCLLPPGFQCYVDYKTLWANFRIGKKLNGTIASVLFNDPLDNLDTYFISLERGFDKSIEISSNNIGKSILCSSKDCPDESKKIKVDTGSEINIIWCPLNSANFVGKELKLVESFQK